MKPLTKAAKKHFPRVAKDKAAQILKDLTQDKKHWSQITGFAYRLPCQGAPLVYALPARYRLVCWLKDGLLHRADVMTHEAYNRYLTKARRYRY